MGIPRSDPKWSVRCGILQFTSCTHAMVRASLVVVCAMEMRRIEEHGLIDRSTENSIEHGEAPVLDTIYTNVYSHGCAHVCTHVYTHVHTQAGESSLSYPTAIAAFAPSTIGS